MSMEELQINHLIFKKKLLGNTYQIFIFVKQIHMFFQTRLIIVLELEKTPTYSQSHNMASNHDTTP